MSWIVLFFACQESKEVNPVYFDADGDGYTSEIDCNDDNEEIYPQAQEICDELDNDCDGLVDSEDDNAVLLSFFYDLDDDGAGGEEVLSCIQPQDTVMFGGDCDDEDSSVFPGNEEVCDGLDNDCDELIDDEDDSIVAETSWYPDEDGDGFGNDALAGYWCSPPPSLILNGGDCDDENPDIHPDAIEVCDEVDNDCDTFLDGDDESLDLSSASIWFADSDNDTQGDSSISVFDCLSPFGFVDNDLDCDDENASLHQLDIDEDGLTSCDGDCDDEDTNSTDCAECVEYNLHSQVGLSLYNDFLDSAPSWDSSCVQEQGSILRWKAPFTDTFVFRLNAPSSPTLSFLGDCEEEVACTSGYEHERLVEEGEILYLGIQGEAGLSFSLDIGLTEESNCGDAVDDDLDGLIDCDDEEDCWYSPSCALGTCPDYDLIDTDTFLPATSLEGISLASAGNDMQGSCISNDGMEYAYFWEAPQTGCLQLMALSDEVDVGLYVFEECGGVELHCNDDSAFVTQQFSVQYGSYVELDVVLGSSWVFVLESESNTSGQADLNLLLNSTISCDGSPIE